MEAPKRGRPKKADTVGTESQIKQRNYQRKYQNEIKQGIAELEKAETDCLKELNKIRKDRTKLIDDLDKANRQAENILKEQVGKKK